MGRPEEERDQCGSEKGPRGGAEARHGLFNRASLSFFTSACARSGCVNDECCWRSEEGRVGEKGADNESNSLLWQPLPRVLTAVHIV